MTRKDGIRRVLTIPTQETVRLRDSILPQADNFRPELLVDTCLNLSAANT